MNPIRNGGRQDLLSLHLDVALPRPRASISVTALRFSHREVLEQGGKGSFREKLEACEHFCRALGHAQNATIKWPSKMAGRQ